VRGAGIEVGVDEAKGSFEDIEANAHAAFVLAHISQTGGHVRHLDVGHEGQQLLLRERIQRQKRNEAESNFFSALLELNA